MVKKLRQITDGIHQTIYQSDLESQLMSTAFFYRLHDVYQSSTVYLAFPCNRTKRYEHSCGAMDVAGKMFFSAITNASEPVLKSFFDEAEKRFGDIVTSVLKMKKTPSYCEMGKSHLTACFNSLSQQGIKDEKKRIVGTAYENYTLVSDPALDHYMPPFSRDSEKRIFLYQCMLQAIRVVALFHDVGHPPYSHIIEEVLIKLYDDVKNDSIDQFDSEKANDLLEILAPYRECKNDGITSLLSSPKENKNELHEQVGLKMLNMALDSVYSDILLKTKGISKVADRSTIAAYYITVAEFCVSILREEDEFFISLHRIIDGCIDADRMDYVVRDTKNSGVNWGVFPYKRLLESCKLSKNEEVNDKIFFIAYPQKMSEDIDDLLITRYKIFSRINYHHRSYKTGMILKRLVYSLSIDFLRKKGENEKSLCEQISDLWCCLSSTLNSNDLYIIQWNDSTLISHLYKTLVEVKKGVPEDYGMSNIDYAEILHMLEEFLLNIKHYYSVFKRESDLTEVYDCVFERLQKPIDIILEHEEKKFEENPNSQEAFDSLNRLSIQRLNCLIKVGDIQALEKIFSVDVNLSEIIKSTLEAYKTSEKISWFLFDENKRRETTGLPKKEDKSDSILLYSTKFPKSKVYDVSILEKQLLQLQNYCLRYIAYIEPNGNAEKVIKEIHKSIEDELFDVYILALRKKFPYLLQSDTTSVQE